MSASAPTICRGDSSDSDNTGGVFVPFDRLKLGDGDFSIGAAPFDVKTAPGHMEETTWFPHNPLHVTIVLQLKDQDYRFSIEEHILVGNSQYFAAALRSGTTGWTEAAQREFKFAGSEASAFGLVIAFLLTGLFPQHPDPKIQPSAAVIDDLIIAYRMSDYLGLRCEERFNRAVCLRLRQILHVDRLALHQRHIGKLYNIMADQPLYFKELCNVFAQAAVKPWLQSWMAKSSNSSKSMIQCSVAFDEHCGKDAMAWARIVAHYVSLVSHSNSFAVDVMDQVRQTMQGAKRINRLVPAQDGANKKVHDLPAFADYVTYTDPLPMGKAHTFTI